MEKIKTISYRYRVDNMHAFNCFFKAYVNEDHVLMVFYFVNRRTNSLFTQIILVYHKPFFPEV